MCSLIYFKGRSKVDFVRIPACLGVFSLFQHNTGETKRYQVQYLLPDYSVFPWPSRGSSSGPCDHRATFLSTTPCWFLRITRCKNAEKTEKLDLTLSTILKNLPSGNGKCDVNVRKQWGCPPYCPHPFRGFLSRLHACLTVSVSWSATGRTPMGASGWVPVRGVSALGKSPRGQAGLQEARLVPASTATIYVPLHLH